jgi:hypothetical protein
MLESLETGKKPLKFGVLPKKPLFVKTTTNPQGERQ